MLAPYFVLLMQLLFKQISKHHPLLAHLLKALQDGLKSAVHIPCNIRRDIIVR
jgi:trans-aconitate methyltransferase